MALVVFRGMTMSQGNIFDSFKALTPRQQSIVCRIQWNIARELEKLDIVHGHRPKEQIDAFIRRLRTLNAFLWKKL